MKCKAALFSRIVALVFSVLLTVALAGCTAKSKPTQSSAALEKAKQIELSSVSFDGLPLSIVISMLHDECVRRDPNRKGVAFSIREDAKQFAETEIHLDLRNVTLAETLERLADSAGLEVEAKESELLLVPKRARN